MKPLPPFAPNDPAADALPIDAGLALLLDAERSRPSPDPAALARMRARLQADLGAGFDGPTGGPGGGPGGTAAPRPALPPSPAASTGASASGFLARPLLLGATTFLLGIGVGAYLHARFDPPPPPVVATRPGVAPAQIVVTAAPAAPTGTPPSPPAVAVSPVVEPPPADPTPAVIAAGPVAGKSHHDTDDHDLDLGRERALLETARTALSRGNADATLDILRRHAHQFPSGRLAEERDSLWVQSLVSSGRHAEARDRAARFRKSHPDSLLLPAVEASLQSIPN